MKSNIALSTSLSWGNNWDPYYSLNITEKWKVDLCQIFVGDNITINLSESVAEYCNNKISLIAHSPVDLNKSALNKDLLKKFTALLNNSDKLVVFHHDPYYPVNDTIGVVKELNNAGITVLLENFYKIRSNVNKTLNHYVEILHTAHKEECLLYPLFDIPRLFIEGVEEFIDPLNETINVFKSIKEIESPVYLHMIDCNSKSQARDTWCSIGEGYIPYSKIFRLISSMGLKIPIAVLEYEEEKHIGKSLDYLREFNLFR